MKVTVEEDGRKSSYDDGKTETTLSEAVEAALLALTVFGYSIPSLERQVDKATGED